MLKNWRAQWLADLSTVELSDEFRFLLGILRQELSPPLRELLVELCASVDRERVCDLAARGGVLGFCARHIELFADDERLSRRLAIETLRVEHHNRQLQQAALEVCDAASNENLRCVPLKGVALHALGVYRDLSLRRMSDIDLWTPRAEFSKMVRLFGKLGYAPSANNPHLARVSHQLTFIGERSGTRIPIELHWTPYFVTYQREGLERALVARLEMHRCAGGQLLMLPPVDLLNTLILHLAGHRFRAQLKWLVDLAELARWKTLDQVALLGEAAALGGLRATARALELATTLLDAPFAQPPTLWGAGMLERLTPPSALIESDEQPIYLQRLLINVLQFDSPLFAGRYLAHKAAELLTRAARSVDA
ncbi:MAG: nucleotidyltransferase family protein [Deltaproteobacteria bacterium]|nr:nucleotidyltransferase family protein [Deltaproteobacteria bacterium]